MERILLVSSTESGAKVLAELLNRSGYSDVLISASGSDARRTLITRDFEVVVINAPLSDEGGEELALHCSTRGATQAILLVKSVISDEVSAKVEEYGVFTLGKPLSASEFYRTVKLASAMYNKLNRLRQESDSLKRKIEDMKLISRAKCLLIEYLGLDEEAAHRYIEKQAMDLRMTRVAVAQNILKTYEN